MLKEEIYARIDPGNIDFLTKIIEAYDNLGVVSTIDQWEGQVIIRVTSDTYAEVMDILQNLPFAITVVS